MKKVLFIDRDGTLIQEPPDYQIDSLEKLSFYPGVFTWLGRIARELDYTLVMVSNQDGLGTAAFPEETFWPAHNKMLEALKGEGIVFSEILIDRSLPADMAPTRKPETGMLSKYLYGQYDLAASVVIGDRITDVQLARNLGCKSILLSDQAFVGADLITTKWEAVYLYLKNGNRKAHISRKTNETDITVSLNLNGGGQANVNTGLPFFDHMLEQLARHGGIDLQIQAMGDLAVDEHHTIEDTALVLGEAFAKALGSKRGIQRYGFLLPMDDCLAQVALDFGGRPYLVWEAEFKREKVGDLPTEMFPHFFKSFCDAAACNLNIKAEGQNEHHKIESIFKAWAKAIKMAIVETDSNSIPSTKGSL